MRAEVSIRQKELEMKQRLLDDEDDDSSLTINIVRGRRNEGEAD